MGEASWQYYARGMLPLSPVAKKSRESAPGESEEMNDGNSEISPTTFEQQDNNKSDLGVDIDKRDLGVDIGPHNSVPSENNLQKRNNRNVMLRRLADCFTYRQKRVNLGAKRHRVMGFHPRLCTIHENASELANDLEVNYQLALDQNQRDRNLLENESSNFCGVDINFSPCCNTNDQKIAALHQDIKELWKRLENVEREFAWARGNLNLTHQTNLK